MPVKDQAAYMREYRARKRAVEDTSQKVKRIRAASQREYDIRKRGVSCEGHTERIAFLEGEVHRLKRALAQANRDLILSRVNRSK